MSLKKTPPPPFHTPHIETHISIQYNFLFFFSPLFFEKKKRKGTKKKVLLLFGVLVAVGKVAKEVITEGPIMMDWSVARRTHFSHCNRSHSIVCVGEKGVFCVPGTGLVKVGKRWGFIGGGGCYEIVWEGEGLTSAAAARMRKKGGVEEFFGSMG